ncbi:hypothetical protein [Streptomyces hokutonensis]|uniref:hypothetical protein n=1 Tax=Streptomyces hokutonensis TaxID=1306990 RepID=UPI003813BDBD
MKHDTGAGTAPAGSASTAGASQWLTLPGCKRVLVVVHTEVYGQRLRDVLPLLASDLRIQVDFTIAPHAFNAGAARSLRRARTGLLPWEEAVSRPYDLVLAAGSQGVEKLRGPLLRLPHGAGHMKLSRLADDRDPRAPRTVGGLGRRYLVRNGKVVPRALALAHRDDLKTLRRRCPEALPGGAARRRSGRRRDLRPDDSESGAARTLPYGARAAGRAAAAGGLLHLGLRVFLQPAGRVAAPAAGGAASRRLPGRGTGPSQCVVRAR